MINMLLLSDFIIILLRELKIDDLPINVLIGEEYFDIEDIFFDEEIQEYILKLSKGCDYKTRAK